MTAFLVRRLTFAVITIWIIVTLVFVLYYVAGPDPASQLAGRAAAGNPQLLHNIRVELGFNDPIPVRYIKYLSRLLHGDLGISNVNRLPVTQIIAHAFPVDLSLAVGAAVIWMVMGLGTGILAARRPRSIWDRAATVLVLTGISMPTFIIGLLLLYVLYYLLTINGIAFFPKPGSYVGFTTDPLTWARDLILPWFTLALITAATYARLTRSSLLEILGEDYIRTARAKGLSERRVIYKHALRSAITPILTQFGIDVATILGGAIVTESVFGLPGLGQQLVLSVGRQDLPVVQGIVLVAAAFIVFANIVVDALYAVIDPRVRIS